MVTRVATVAFEGIEARAVDVQVQIIPGSVQFAVVGLPDPRFGETITALVELIPGAVEPGIDELKTWVRSQLADYKAPRRVLVVESIHRSPNGKLDYKTLKARALEALGAA